jgi:hypothetical protein
LALDFGIGTDLVNFCAANRTVAVPGGTKFCHAIVAKIVTTSNNLDNLSTKKKAKWTDTGNIAINNMLSGKLPILLS